MPDLIAMLHKGLKRLETDFDAMVIANQAVNFSVGANWRRARNIRFLPNIDSQYVLGSDLIFRIVFSGL